MEKRGEGKAPGSRLQIRGFDGLKYHVRFGPPGKTDCCYPPFPQFFFSGEGGGAGSRSSSKDGMLNSTQKGYDHAPSLQQFASGHWNTKVERESGTNGLV